MDQTRWSSTPFILELAFSLVMVSMILVRLHIAASLSVIDSTVYHDVNVRFACTPVNGISEKSRKDSEGSGLRYASARGSVTATCDPDGRLDGCFRSRGWCVPFGSGRQGSSTLILE